MYLGDLMEKAESGQFLVLSFLLQEAQTTVKQAMEETGFSKATLTLSSSSKRTLRPTAEGVCWLSVR